MAPFIDLGEEFGDTKEAVLAPEGKEYDIFCKEVEELEKDGKKSIRIMCLIEGEEDEFAPFSHFISIPNRELDQRNDEEKGHKPGTTSNMKRLMTKRFLEAFRIDYTPTGFDPQDIVGARARLPLTQEMYADRRNQRITLPPLPDEEGGSKEAKKAPAKKKSK